MAEEKAIKEKAIVAVGLCGHYTYMAYEGPEQEAEMENWSCSPNDVLGDGTFPESVGIYYWEGRAEWRSYMSLDGPSDPELEWQDEVVRLATAEDLSYFGLTSMAPICEVQG